MSRPIINPDNPPGTICLVRLSAIGDVTHMLPIVNTIRSHWPQTKITWIIGKSELELVRGLPDIELITFNKNRGVCAYLDLRQQLRGRRFDVLLLMQVSLRANLIPPFINAPIKIGFDRRRAKNLHRLFINRSIAAKTNQHVLDGLFCFTEALGITEKKLTWDLIRTDAEQTFAAGVLPETDQRTLLISPCASHASRNWPPKHYAEVADHAIKTHAMRVVLTGGYSEHRYAQQITAAMHSRPVDLVGRTTLRQLLAVIARADVVISPDSGPAHLATCAGKPVIGLYAASNPGRTGPYLSRERCVNRYPEAVRRYLGKDWRTIKWGTRVKHPGVMELITVADVCKKLDDLMFTGIQQSEADKLPA